MAFSFGSASAFGTTPSPFGATTPAPAFGAATSSPLATPLFGGFGQSSAAAATTTAATSQPLGTPAFGAFSFSAQPTTSQPAATPTFGFGSAAATSSPFSFAAAPASATSSPFSLAPSTGGAFSFPSAATPGATPTLAPAQPGYIKYSTKWEELTPDQQKQFTDMQKEIHSYRDDCEKLEKEQRLQDSNALKKGMEEETASLKQTLQSLHQSLKSDEEALTDYHDKVMKLLKSAEGAVRTFQRSKVWREAPQLYKGQTIPPAMQELLAAPVVLPSPFLEESVEGFGSTVQDYSRVLGEVEQALALTASLGSLASADVNVNQSLLAVINNMHEYFVHVASKAAALHDEVNKAKEVFLAQRRAHGEYTDPFEQIRRSNVMTTSSKPMSFTSAGSPSHHHHHHTAGSFPVGAPAVGVGLTGLASAPSSAPSGALIPGALPLPGLAQSPSFSVSTSPQSDLSRRNTAGSQSRRRR